MTIITRSNQYGSLSEETLAAFEQETGKHIPAPYRAFLLQHNGGTPEPACFMAIDDPFKAGSALAKREIVCFFALHKNPWDDSTMEGSRAWPLQEACRDLERYQHEAGLLPIGKDWSGNYICLVCDGEKSGEIAFFDHEYEAVTPLAPDFDTFFLALQARDEW